MRSGVRNGPRPDISSDLLRAAEILWGRSDKVRVSIKNDPPSSFRPLETFAVLPNAGRPRLLIPLGSRRAASASVRQFIVSMNGRARLVRALLTVGTRAGVAQPLARDRLYVSVDKQARAGDLSEFLVEEHLREVFGRPDLQIAVKLDKVRPNWKPVLQLVTPDGHVLGYAKVGWNELTRGLVRNEAKALERCAMRRPSTFRFPRVLYSGRWRDLDIIVVSPVPQRLWSRGPLNLAPPIEATYEVATLFGVEQGPVSASDYWERTRQRVADTRADGSDGVLEDLDASVNGIERRCGEAFLPFGSWHGDWAPWNMTWLRDTLYVWDWERSGAGVPLGFDVLHYEFQAAIRLERKSVDAAVQACGVRSAPFLEAMGVAPEVQPAVFLLYLLELFLRYHESRAAGVRSSDEVYVDLLRVLTERVRSPAA